MHGVVTAMELRLDHASIEVPHLGDAVGSLDGLLGLEVTVSPQAPERHQGEPSKEYRMSTGQQARRAERTAKHAVESGPIKTLGRVGLIAYGVVHLLVAYLAVRVALGGGGKADKTGALQAIAEQSGGRFLLWVLTSVWPP